MILLLLVYYGRFRSCSLLNEKQFPYAFRIYASNAKGRSKTEMIRTHTNSYDKVGTITFLAHILLTIPYEDDFRRTFVTVF